MALKFRRGTTAQQSGSLAFGEPFVNTTLQTLLVGGNNGDITLATIGTGSTGVFGDISGSGLDITGNARIGGNLVLGGNITIGDANTDTIALNADLSSSIIPDVTNTFDLGSTTKVYRNVYATSISGAIAATNGVVSGSSQIISILTPLNTFSGSQLTQNTALATITGSLISSASAAKSTNDSQGVSITNLNSATASLQIETTNLELFSASALTRLTNLETETSNLEIYTGSLKNAIQITGSTVSFLGNIVVYGTQSIINSTNVELADNILYLAPTASIDNDLGIVGHYNDGTYRHAGIFMDASDGHSWKVFNGLQDETIGTVNTSGTGFALADFKAGAITGTSLNGIINATNGVVSGSSQVIGILSSLNTYTGSNDTTNTTQTSRLDQLSTASGSAITRLTALEVETANLEAFSSSTLTRLTNIETETANLEAFTSSINTTIKTKLNAETVVSSSVQIDLTATSNYIGGILTRLNAVGVVSGSKTISGITLGSNLATLTIGTGLSGTSYNGSTGVTIANTGVTSITTNTGLSTNAGATGGVTITNTGVTSNVAGTGISVSGATGAVTITNTGVTSAVAGTGVGVSAGTGAVTISIGQSVATTATPTFGNLTINGTITATGDITAYYTSDKRHKNNIQLIPNALEKVSKLNGVTWEWNDDVNEVTKSTPKTGLIAQEVQEVLPQVVVERENGYLGLDYSKMIGLLVEAIKEQQTQIEELKAQIGSK